MKDFFPQNKLPVHTLINNEQISKEKKNNIANEHCL